MRPEYFPKMLPFVELERLRKYDIEIAVDGSTGALVWSDGKRIAVQKDDYGNAVFSGDMPPSVHTAIAREWEIDLFPKIQRTHVVVKGPGHDPRFISESLRLAEAHDCLLGARLEHSNEFPETRFANYELPYCVDFGHTVLQLIGKGLNRDAFCEAFCFHLHKSPFGHEFAVMVDIGFFRRAGDHYEFAIPPEPDIERIIGALRRMLETEDEQLFLHPERYLITMSKFDAKNLCRRLRKQSLKAAGLVELTPAGHEALASAASVENGAGAELG